MQKRKIFTMIRTLMIFMLSSTAVFADQIDVEEYCLKAREIAVYASERQKQYPDNPNAYRLYGPNHGEDYEIEYWNWILKQAFESPREDMSSTQFGDFIQMQCHEIAEESLLPY